MDHNLWSKNLVTNLHKLKSKLKASDIDDFYSHKNKLVNILPKILLLDYSKFSDI